MSQQQEKDEQCLSVFLLLLLLPVLLAGQQQALSLPPTAAHTSTDYKKKPLYIAQWVGADQGLHPLVAATPATRRPWLGKTTTA